MGPGSYLLRANASAPGAGATPTWVVKSITSGGRDVMDAPLDVQSGVDVSDLVVTFTDQVRRLTGLVSDQAGRPVPTYSVIAFPTDAAHWNRQSRWMRPPQRPASDGRFAIAGLPPGEYYLAVLVDYPPNDWATPGFLETVVPGAIRVTIREGETTTQDVKLAGG